jgi:hypothetical protein
MLVAQPAIFQTFLDDALSSAGTVASVEGAVGCDSKWNQTYSLCFAFKWQLPGGHL